MIQSQMRHFALMVPGSHNTHRINSGLDYITRSFVMYSCFRKFDLTDRFIRVRHFHPGPFNYQNPIPPANFKVMPTHFTNFRPARLLGLLL